MKPNPGDRQGQVDDEADSQATVGLSLFLIASWLAAPLHKRFIKTHFAAKKQRCLFGITHFNV